MINTIRSKQKELCSSVEVHEYLISPSDLSHVPHRDFSQLTVFAMEDVARNVRDNKRFVSDVDRKERISLKHLLHFDPYQVLSSTAVRQLFGSDGFSEPVPASFFAGRSPLVSAWFLCQMCVVQSVDSGSTDNGIIVIIVDVLFLPFPCVCRSRLFLPLLRPHPLTSYQREHLVR